ncbi:MAG: MFS transporter [Culicoidibacterales bacterium]
MVKYKKISAYYFFSGFLPFLPVLILIYINRGIELYDVFLFESVYLVVISLLEIPSGYLGDKIGHLQTVVMGVVIQSLAFLIFAFSFSVPSIIISQVLLGIGNSLISGSEQIVLKNMCFNFNQEYLFVRKQMVKYFTLGNLVSYLLGGLLLIINKNGEIIFLFTAIASSVCLIMLRQLSSDIKSGNSVELNDTEKSYVKDRSILKNLNFTILIFTGVFGLILAVISNMMWFQQIYYSEIGFNSFTTSIMFILGAILTMIFSHKIIEITTRKRLLILLLIPLCYFLFLYANVFVAVGTVVLIALIKSDIRPFVEDEIIKLSHENQALHLSVAS